MNKHNRAYHAINAFSEQVRKRLENSRGMISIEELCGLDPNGEMTTAAHEYIEGHDEQAERIEREQDYGSERGGKFNG